MELNRALLVYTFAFLCIHLSTIVAQESRTWTATTGHTLEGTLVSYDKANVEIQDVTGKIKSVPKVKLSPIDQNYIMDFPNLDNNTKFAKGKLPNVDVRAVRSGGTKGDNLGVDITLNNRHKEDLEVEVLWVFYTPPPKTGKITSAKPTNLLPLEPRMTRLTLKALKELNVQTLKARGARLSNGKAWESSMKITGFVVQVYAKGQLLDGYTSNGVLADLAKDPGLLKHFKN